MKELIYSHITVTKNIAWPLNYSGIKSLLLYIESLHIVCLNITDFIVIINGVYRIKLFTTEKFKTRRIQIMRARFKIVNTMRNRMNA